MNFENTLHVLVVCVSIIFLLVIFLLSKRSFSDPFLKYLICMIVFGVYMFLIYGIFFIWHVCR